MNRRTSIEAYNKIRTDGLLSSLQWAVYHVIFYNGPLTQGELWKYHFPEHQRHSIAPRFAELKDRGVLAPVGERPCRVTGVKALVWDVTDALPHEPAPAQKGIHHIIEDLRAEVRQLKDRITKLEEARYDTTGQGLLALRNH